MLTNIGKETCVNSVDAYDAESAMYVFQRVAKAATQYPDRVALITPSGEFTYEWLNTEANRLAHHLLACGGDKGNRYAVCTEPSVHVFVALLAIHKIGGVYVPIDASFPAARILDMLSEVEPSAVLFYGGDVPQALLQATTDNSSVKFIDLSQINEVYKQYPTSDPTVDICESDISHIFFTSGTTGKPKGVLATHGNLRHYLNSAALKYGFNQNDIFIAAAKYTFSISFFELLLPLWVGASVMPVPRADVLDMKKLSAYFERATVFHIGPSLLKKVLPYIEKTYENLSVFSNMRHVSSGGDHVPPDVLEALKRIFITAEVYVIYGSTEISCMGCTWLVPRDGIVERTYVGLPHLDTSIRIEDSNGNLVSPGEAGELLFESPGVVKGYLNLPDLTAEKFVERGGKRYYRIGDIGKIAEDGLLRLMGRKDYQVQFHGIRIELLEIESTIRKYGEIQDCVVVGLNEAHSEEISLVAYVVLRSPNEFSLQNLLVHLNSYLPEYMIPARFVGLPQLPLNHNGKLDRSQLPEPSLNNMLVTSKFVTASGDIENTLVSMWETLFDLKGIGVNHDFFEIGGDSLLAVQFLGLVSEKFQRFIPITSLLQFPTIAQIAKILSGEVEVPEMGNVTVLKTGDTSLPPLFCLYGVFLYQELADAFNLPNMVCGVYLQEEVDLINEGVESAAFKAFTNVATIAQKYVDSITQYQQTGPYYLCGESFGGIIALEAAKLLEARGETVKLIAMLDSNAPGFLDSLARMERLKKHFYKLRMQGTNYLIQGGAYKLRKLKNSLATRLGISLREMAQNPDQDLRVNVRHIASQSYSPEYSQHSIKLFKAKIRSDFEPDNTDLGWGKIVSNVSVYEIDGDHLGILKGNSVRKIANIIELSFNR